MNEAFEDYRVKTERHYMAARHYLISMWKDLQISLGLFLYGTDSKKVKVSASISVIDRLFALHPFEHSIPISWLQQISPLVHDIHILVVAINPAPTSARYLSHDALIFECLDSFGYRRH